MALRPLVGLGILNEFPPSRSGTSHPVDRPVAEISTLKTHNTHKRKKFMCPAGFEAAIPAKESSQTDALDPTATGIGTAFWRQILFLGFFGRLRKKNVTLKIKRTRF